MVKFTPGAYFRSHLPPPGNERKYIQSYFVAMLGNGIFIPIYMLYCTQIVGIPYAKTGLAITIGGLTGIPLSLLAGDLADRVGPRRVVFVGLGGQLLGMGSYVFIQGFWSLMIVVGGMNIFAFTYFSSVGALMRRIGGENTPTFRAQVRAFGNMGVAIGALGAGVGIEIGTRTSYHVMFLLVSTLYLIVLFTTLRLPNYGPLPRPESGVEQEKVTRWLVLRDKAFISYALAAGAMAMSNFVLDMLVPVWIVVYTSAPRWTVTVVYVINTVMVILFQVRLSRNIKTTRQGGFSMRRAGIVLMLGYLVMATMAGHAAWIATVLVVVGMVLLSLAEIWLYAGRFTLEFSLPPAYAQGQYDGLLTTITTVSVTITPLVLVGFVLGRGYHGWIGLGAFFLLLGLLCPLIAAWGERTRPQETTPAQTEAAGAAAV
ncbi:MFS transporter [Actinospica durhamensis]|uniref:MFS transporter n=1 Tax=Actinospica durhamensis TaxID=1508375 RepID=A0A941IMJ8_9ACTN|nr:MFS transporter [Actinospica durhamensis]MBR7834255.1 MFS transporter [Actinospica durhamensis]